MMNTLLHKVKEYQKAFTKKPDKAGQQKLVAAQAKQKESAKKYTKASKQLMCSAALAKTAKIDKSYNHKAAVKAAKARLKSAKARVGKAKAWAKKAAARLAAA